MNIRPIGTERGDELAVREVERISGAKRGRPPLTGSTSLAILVEDHEREHFPPAAGAHGRCSRAASFACGAKRTGSARTMTRAQEPHEQGKDESHRRLTLAQPEIGRNRGANGVFGADSAAPFDDTPYPARRTRHR